MKLKHLKALCKTLEDYENKCGDAEIDFLIDGKVYTPATFECNLDDRGNVWGDLLQIVTMLTSSICVSVAPKSDSVA